MIEERRAFFADDFSYPGIRDGIGYRPRTFFTALVLLFAAGCGGGGNSIFIPPAPPPTLHERIASLLKDPFSKNAGLDVGFSIAFVQAKSGSGVTASAPARGLYFFGNLVEDADHTTSLPLDANTSYEIGSVTKTFTATLLAILANANPFVLPIATNSYLPLAVMNPAVPSYLGTPTEIVQLANYTSGLVDVNLIETDTGCAHVPDPCFLTSSMIANFSSTPVTFQPGSSFLYSDLGYALLSFALPRINGSTTTNPDSLQDEYETLLVNDVLRPIGMPTSHMFDEAVDGPNLPLSYDDNGNIAVNHNTTWPAYFGAGGIVSSPAEMLTYLQFNLGLLNTGLEPLLPLLQSPTTTVTTTSGGAIGLGWFIDTLPGSSLKFINKNGGVSGFATQIDFTPSTGAGVVVMVNSRKLAVGDIAMKILQILNGLPRMSASSNNGDGG